MNQEFYNQIKELSIKYSAAMRQMETYIKILEEDFIFRYDYNPIDHVVTRLKTPESIVEKLERNNWGLSVSNIEKHIFDIAGIRIVCPFEADVEKIISLLRESQHIEIIREKDYFSHPKKSGYRSYHVIVKSLVHLISGNETVPVEIQIRTLSQDFWASLEHQITYKYKGEIPKEIAEELRECSDVANLLDKKMYDLSNELHKAEQKT